MVTFLKFVVLTLGVGAIFSITFALIELINL